MLWEAFLTAYLQANVLLAISLLAWLAVTGSARLAGRQLAAPARQRLLRLAITTAVALPTLLLLAESVAAGGDKGLILGFDAPDRLISAYLGGRLALSLAEVSTVVEAMLSAFALLSRIDDLSYGLAGPLVLAWSVLLATRILIGALELRGALRRCHPWRRVGRTSFLVSETARVPFATRSLRRRYIVVPVGLLGSGDKLRLAIAHEAQHLRNGDVEWVFLLDGLGVLMFWNPALLLWRRESERLRELACDRAVIRRKRLSVGAYCGFLLSLGGSGRQRPVLPAVAGPQGFGQRGERLLRRRIEALLGGGGAEAPRSIFSLAASALVGAIFTASLSLQPPDATSALKLHLATLSNLESLAHRESERGYNLVMAY